jgi:hypothetical protein
MGRSKTPEQSSQSKKAEALQIKVLEQQIKDAKKPLVLPKIDIPKPLPPQAPPQEGDDVAYASQETRKKAMRRTNAGRGTLLAGETGGMHRRTLLG